MKTSLPDLFYLADSFLDYRISAFKTFFAQSLEYPLRRVVGKIEKGAGRIGRLWQTVILRKWREIFALLPVESVIRDRQSDYYAALGVADAAGDATGFIEFMLGTIRQAVEESAKMTDQVGDQVSDQVKKLLSALVVGPKSAAELMAVLGLSHRPTFRKNYLHPAMAANFIEMTLPDSPNAKNQKYALTPKASAWWKDMA